MENGRFRSRRTRNPLIRRSPDQSELLVPLRFPGNETKIVEADHLVSGSLWTAAGNVGGTGTKHSFQTEAGNRSHVPNSLASLDRREPLAGTARGSPSPAIPADGRGLIIRSSRSPSRMRVVLEAGQLEMLPNGKLAVSTRRGEVYLISNPLSDDPAKVTHERFAHGLHEVLGLAYREGWLYVT